MGLAPITIAVVAVVVAHGSFCNVRVVCDCGCAFGGGRNEYAPVAVVVAPALPALAGVAVVVAAARATPIRDSVAWRICGGAQQLPGRNRRGPCRRMHLW